MDIPARPDRPDDLTLLPATRLAAMLRAREVSARELLEAHLDRVDRLNPTVNALVTLDVEGARAAATAADRALVRGGALGALHGLPVGHKDTHLTAGLRTTFGSPVHRDFVPSHDELVVARLRGAGAIRLGKTNVPEFAAGSHTTNPVFGPTRNPHDPSRSAGGSSGGAAAALATGMVALAEGSDMGGSLRNPAAFCGVVGLRPTPGRVPTFPATLGFSTLSVQGPLGRTVGDVALGLSVLAGPDPRVPISLSEPGTSFTPPVREDLTGLRVAWAPDLGGRVPVDSEVRDALAGVPGLVADLGGELALDCPDLDEADEVFTVLRAWLFAASLGPVVDAHPELVNAAIHGNVAAGRRLSGADLARAEAAHTRLHVAVAEFFTRHDVLLAPTSQVVPFDVDTEYPAVVDGVTQQDYLGWMRSCTLVSACGVPALSLPAGATATGLPVGLAVIGPPRAEQRVLEVGHALEHALGRARVVWSRDVVAVPAT